jgi:hypothetical protein
VPVALRPDAFRVREPHREVSCAPPERVCAVSEVQPAAFCFPLELRAHGDVGLVVRHGGVVDSGFLGDLRSE